MADTYKLCRGEYGWYVFHKFKSQRYSIYYRTREEAVVQLTELEGIPMTMYPTIVKAFAAYSFNDEYARHRKLIGYYSTEEKAKAAADGQGWFDSEGIIREATLLYINASLVYALVSDDNVQLDVNIIEVEKQRKAKALEKLIKTMTADELKALCIDVGIL